MDSAPLLNAQSQPTHGIDLSVAKLNNIAIRLTEFILVVLLYIDPIGKPKRINLPVGIPPAIFRKCLSTARRQACNRLQLNKKPVCSIGAQRGRRCINGEQVETYSVVRDNCRDSLRLAVIINIDRFHAGAPPGVYRPGPDFPPSIPFVLPKRIVSILLSNTAAHKQDPWLRERRVRGLLHTQVLLLRPALV